MASLTVNGFREGESVGVAVIQCTRVHSTEGKKEKKKENERRNEKVREGIFYKLFIIYDFPHSLTVLSEPKYEI